jgi:low temperature requirement protein LtrA
MVQRRRITGDTSPATQVTTLELFFDLVFVFTITQVTRLLEHDLTPVGAGRALLVFGVLWWMYGGYAWLTNQVPPRTASRRILLLTGMVGFLLTAVATPTVFETTGVLFGVGYLVVNAVHLLLFRQSAAPHTVARLAACNLLSAALVLAGGFLHGWAQLVGLAAALLVQFVTPRFVAPHFDLNAAHFVERHGLLMIVALGESVIAIGMAVDVGHLTLDVVGTVVLALALPAALWWAYFSGDDIAAEQVLDSAEPGRRGMLAIRAYFYAHIPMLLGVVALAAGMHGVVAHPSDPLTVGYATALAAGVALFFLGDVQFRRVLGVGPVRLRLLAAIGALVTLPIGLLAAAGLQLLVVVVVVVAALTLERRETRQAVEH